MSRFHLFTRIHSSLARRNLLKKLINHRHIHINRPIDATMLIKKKKKTVATTLVTGQPTKHPMKFIAYNIIKTRYVQRGTVIAAHVSTTLTTSSYLTSYIITNDRRITLRTFIQVLKVCTSKTTLHNIQIDAVCWPIVSQI
ncbi:unnamed protein product [Ixodes persulcatus]